MKTLLTIVCALCLLSTPLYAWEKFDGTITDTVIYMPKTIIDMTLPHPDDDVITPDPEPVEPVEPNIDLETLRLEMGLEAVAEYVESIPGVHVYDDYDYYIGLLIGFDGSQIMIYLTSIESVFTLDSKTGAAKSAFIYYSSDDCTGKPYVHASTQYSITKACDTLYTGKRKSPRFMTTNSRLRVDDNKCACWEHSLESYFTPAVEVPARTVGLYLPVALPLRFQAWSMPTD